MRNYFFKVQIEIILHFCIKPCSFWRQTKVTLACHIYGIPKKVAQVKEQKTAPKKQIEKEKKKAAEKKSELIEPMMNIHCFYEEENGWRVLIMLRAKHRPMEFYKEGEERIIFSPAACDYGGLCITPLENDFNRLDGELLNDIFKEVSIGDLEFRSLKEELIQNLTLLF